MHGYMYAQPHVVSYMNQGVIFCKALWYIGTLEEIITRNKYLRGEKYVQSSGTSKINRKGQECVSMNFTTTACATIIQQTFITIINNVT